MWKFKGWFGRPMKCVDRCLFVDVVSGKEVGVYRDAGTSVEYMAEGPWSWFRIALSRRNHGTVE